MKEYEATSHGLANERSFPVPFTRSPFPLFAGGLQRLPASCLLLTAPDLVGGGSGHGFKHGPAVGDHVSALILGDAKVEPGFARRLRKKRISEKCFSRFQRVRRKAVIKFAIRKFYRPRPHIGWRTHSASFGHGIDCCLILLFTLSIHDSRFTHRSSATIMPLGFYTVDPRNHTSEHEKIVGLISWSFRGSFLIPCPPRCVLLRLKEIYDAEAPNL